MSTFELASGIGLAHEQRASAERRHGVLSKLQAIHAERRASRQAVYEAQRRELEAASREADAFMTHLIDAHAHKARLAGGKRYEAAYTVPEGQRQGETIVLSHTAHKNRKGEAIDPNYGWWDLQVTKANQPPSLHRMRLHRPASGVQPELVAITKGQEMPRYAMSHDEEVGHLREVKDDLSLVAQGMRSKELVVQTK